MVWFMREDFNCTFFEMKLWTEKKKQIEKKKRMTI